MMGQRANVTTYSAFTDEELHHWLVWADEHGTSFLQAIATAAFVSDLKQYHLLQPVLLELRKMYPENSWVLPLDARVDRAEH
jgi:hypothetical protein